MYIIIPRILHQTKTFDQYFNTMFSVILQIDGI